jgi:hypothetical protein
MTAAATEFGSKMVASRSLNFLSETIGDWRVLTLKTLD